MAAYNIQCEWSVLHVCLSKSSFKCENRFSFVSLRYDVTTNDGVANAFYIFKISETFATSTYIYRVFLYSIFKISRFYSFMYDTYYILESEYTAPRSIS